jgi:hypothetical protein
VLSGCTWICPNNNYTPPRNERNKKRRRKKQGKRKTTNNKPTTRQVKIGSSDIKSLQYTTKCEAYLDQ